MAKETRPRTPVARAIALMRVCLIAFWLTMMVFTWVLGSMTPGQRLLATVWCSGIALAGMIILRNNAREMIRGQRLSTRCCLVCGYDLRFTQDRCPECGTVPTGGLTPGELEMLRLVRETYGANIISERVVTQARDTGVIVKLRNEKLQQLRVNLTDMARQRKKGTSLRSLKAKLRFD
jgi:hypothetical protein